MTTGDGRQVNRTVTYDSESNTVTGTGTVDINGEDVNIKLEDGQWQGTREIQIGGTPLKETVSVTPEKVTRHGEIEVQGQTINLTPEAGPRGHETWTGAADFNVAGININARVQLNEKGLSVGGYAEGPDGQKMFLRLNQANGNWFGMGFTPLEGGVLVTGYRLDV